MNTPKPILNDSQIDLAPLQSRKVVMLGYGNQGRPQSLNLRDSGIDVRVGARDNSANRAQAEADGLQVMSIRDALAWGDVIMMMLPDEVMADAYAKSIAPHLRKGQYLGFSHGLVIHEQWIQPAADINVFLLAPKGQGRGVRNKYLAGTGVPGLYGVHQDPAGDTKDVALGYGKAIGCGRVGMMPTTFAEETVSDLFSEQAVLCGGLSNLIMTAFETLVEAGFSPEVAYFECLYEVKLIADLLHEKGISGTREAISSTARYGDISRGDAVIDAHVRENMRRVLSDITSGKFAAEMRAEFAQGQPSVRQRVMQDEQHLIERTHRRLHQELQF